MATWRFVRTGYVVSTDGKSLRTEWFSSIVRYDSPKGWIDLATTGERNDNGESLCCYFLPQPGVSHWRTVGDVPAGIITETDVTEIMNDIEAAASVWDRLYRFDEVRWVY